MRFTVTKLGRNICMKNNVMQLISSIHFQYCFFIFSPQLILNIFILQLVYATTLTLTCCTQHCISVDFSGQHRIHTSWMIRVNVHRGWGWSALDRPQHLTVAGNHESTRSAAKSSDIWQGFQTQKHQQSGNKWALMLVQTLSPTRLCCSDQKKTPRYRSLTRTFCINEHNEQ